MANKIQLEVDIGTISPAADGENRQQYAQKIAERLLVYLPSSNSTFVIGGSQPTSDEGPWFKEVIDSKSGNSGYELWVWSTDAATYKPLTLNQIQLRYFYGEAEPSSSVYDIWFKVDSNGKPLGILTYNGSSGAWEAASYTPDEIDNFFEGESGGKKTVDWSNLINVPASAANSPRAVSGSLDPSDAKFDWEQVYHTDAGTMVVYDSIASAWKTLDGGIGDLKEVSGTSVGTTGDFAAGIFTTVLGKNPGWEVDTASAGRVIVGVADELWDSITTNKKEAGSIHGVDDFNQTIAQLPTNIDIDIKRSDAINGGGPASNGYMTGDVATGSSETLVTTGLGGGDPISLVQKSIAYYRLRKVL